VFEEERGEMAGQLEAAMQSLSRQKAATATVRP